MERSAFVVAVLVAVLVVASAQAEEPDGVHDNLMRGQLAIGISFTGGPFFLMGGKEWLGVQIDLEPRLAMIQGSRVTRHIRLRISNEVLYHGAFSAKTWLYGAYRPSVGILIADDRPESSVLPFFSVRGGIQIQSFRSPARPEGDLTAEVIPYFPIGGGIEVPKDGPVMFHFELGAVFPEALWFAFPDEYFGWLPIYFEIGAVFQPGSPGPTD